MSGLSSAKNASIIAVSAALYALFFFLSSLIATPNFVVLYLPVILLGTFPLWFGLPGLAGSMIGAIAGGLFVESLGFAAWIEAVTTCIIFTLNWLFMPRNLDKEKGKNYVLLLSVYAFTLFLGTVYVLWQLAFIGIFPMEVAFFVLLLPTFSLNFVIEATLCPVLLRLVSPKLKAWGVYAGNFWEWWAKRNR